MWITRQAAGGNAPSAAETGTVTLSGETLAVYLQGEKRGLSLFSPGGIIWRPEVGDTVLTLTTDSGGTVCVTGCLCQPPEDLEPGELLLKSRGASLCLRNDGTIEVIGTVVYSDAKEDVSL